LDGVRQSYTCITSTRALRDLDTAFFSFGSKCEVGANDRRSVFPRSRRSLREWSRKSRCRAPLIFGFTLDRFKPPARSRKVCFRQVALCSALLPQTDIPAAASPELGDFAGSADEVLNLGLGSQPFMIPIGKLAVGRSTVFFDE
jgi:hypothetical protein